ncbi:probable serine/threonine protein kinase IREH1 isoform X1 [Zingiber officinale]|uniref:probable serine/threonine protein kinase IREH1 isoform X1 n=1 Tax=Zingiber officinale TaxID=94328 RepID=UPI001C4CE9B8|nr:probable serine/threonine protein kinase IREH1 isoform X1 [Zingiber officinale]
MVFKARFFSSKKSDSSSSPDGSNSPAGSTFASTSSARSEKKKSKSPSSVSSPRHTVIHNAVEKHHLQQQLHKKKDKDGKESKGKEAANSPSPKPSPPTAPSALSKLRRTPATVAVEVKDAEGAPPIAALSPILASSLGLNRIKTRSGPLPQEGSRGEHRMSGIGGSNLSRAAGYVSMTGGKAVGVSSTGTKKDGRTVVKVAETSTSSWVDRGTSGAKQWSTISADAPFERQGNIGKAIVSRSKYVDLKSNATFASEVESPYDACETPKESESPRFKEIMQATSAPRKKMPGDVKSFSHELSSKGVRPFPFWKPRSTYNLKEVLKVIQVKFEKAKEEVNSDLAIFAGDLVSIMEKNLETHPEWKEILEDLLILARSCCVMTPGEFWLQCEVIVQDLDDRRQELSSGMLKKLYTHILFILTRCTRLLQFHKEHGFPEDGMVMDPGSKVMLSAEVVSVPSKDGKYSRSEKKSVEAGVARKSYSQEQHNLKWKRSQEIKPVDFFSENIAKDDPFSTRERISSWKALPSPAPKNQKEFNPIVDVSLNAKTDSLTAASSHPDPVSLIDAPRSKSVSSKHQHEVSWDFWSDQQSISEEGSIMCRICEEYVPTLYVEEHSKVCAVADRCDQKGLSVDERLIRIAEKLEKMMDSYGQKDLHNLNGSPDVTKVSNSSVTEESDIPSPKLSDWAQLALADMVDCLHESENPLLLDDLKNLPSMTCKTRPSAKSDQGMTTSSAGSMTPRSPLMTPRGTHIDMLLTGMNAVSEGDDFSQMNKLADIARCIANASVDGEGSLNYLVSCLENLQEVMNRRKREALAVQTFATRIEKLHREKCLQLCDSVAPLEMEKADALVSVMDEEDDIVRSLRASPIHHHASKDRTSIDDFEIIKPISRGAYGRVFLAKKRTTGDLFAIKVLKKADMIRKNAVESILAERNILISVRNPFVVRFFYSFTSRENLYLVMEYLNGGDLYSLLRNLGCLDEDVARIYIAEIVLALEYLHSLRVVHRDLKPDNLLIAHDGHIKLTDFGLSKVGLINSTDDLSGPAVSGTSLYGEDEPQVSASEQLNQRDSRKKRSAVGTPDYLAPEILLGTGHGASADWWSVGVILFELIVGIPPFNAAHPQKIFDNILNCKIPWPKVPEEMSFEAYDLIDKLLTEDPHQRLGAEGASEVKEHMFFKDINWDTLARQKAAFVPSSDNALDTSYFTSRYSWNPSDEQIYEASEFEDSSDDGSISGNSSCISNNHDELGDECGGIAEFDSISSVNYSFSNFSFKNLSQLASINYDILSKGFKEDPRTKPEI